MQIKQFVGIDVSKETVDFTVVINGKAVSHYCILNNTREIKSVVNKILKALGSSYEETIF